MVRGARAIAATFDVDIGLIKAAYSTDCVGVRTYSRDASGCGPILEMRPDPDLILEQVGKIRLN